MEHLKSIVKGWQKSMLPFTKKLSNHKHKNVNFSS